MPKVIHALRGKLRKPPSLPLLSFSVSTTTTDSVDATDVIGSDAAGVDGAVTTGAAATIRERGATPPPLIATDVETGAVACAERENVAVAGIPPLPATRVYSDGR